MKTDYLISKGFRIVDNNILYQFAINKEIKLVRFYDNEWEWEKVNKDRIVIDTADKLNALLILFGYEDSAT